MRVKIVAACTTVLLLLSAQASFAADLKETGGKLWRIVSGKSVKDQKDVKDLLEKWLAAQNSGNFGVYESCYASRFQGVRRTGNFTLRLDRAGWMKDRGRMFKKPMTVQMDKVEIVLTPPSAVVRFEQTWASGKYKDVGPKEMVAAEENGAWKITREELLQSNVLSGRKGKVYGAAEGERFFFARELGSTLHVILDPSSVSAPAGSAVLEGQEYVYPISNSDSGKWMKKKFRFFDNDGNTCEGTVSRVEQVSQATPHFGTADKWLNGGMSKEEVAQEKWDLGRKMLAGHVEDHDCGSKMVLWGQPLNLKGAAVDALLPAEGVQERALQLFRGLPSYAAVQKRYEQETGSQDRWDASTNEKPVVLVFSSSANPKLKVVSVFMTRGTGCGVDFTGQLWQLWRMEADGKWSEVAFESADHAFSLAPANVVDGGGSGGLEWVAREGMSKTHFLRLDGEFLVPEKTLEIPFYDCPC